MRGARKPGARANLDALDAVDHAARILEPRQQGMGVVFEIQVGVLLALDHVAGKRGAEKAGQAEIVAAPAALVVERGLVGGHQPAALFDERLQLCALRVGQVGDIRQGQDLELPHVRRVELAVQDHFEGDPGFHQCVVEPGRVVLRGPRATRTPARRGPAGARCADTSRSSSARRKGPRRA